MATIWETCRPNDDQLSCIQELENLLIVSPSSSELMSSFDLRDSQLNSKSDGLETMYSLLTSVEASCSSFISNLDNILLVLDDVSRSHRDITGRTNVLMMNCEALLEQQVSSLKATDRTYFLLALNKPSC
jgi:hypothetical protein